MNFSYRDVAAATAIISTLLAGCGAKATTPVTPAQFLRSTQSQGQGNGEAAPAANPARLVFSSKNAAPETFTVTIQYAGDLTAASSDTNIATVDPQSAGPNVVQNDDGTKSATFTVTPVWFGTTKITITDKKGSTAAVTVVVNDGGIFN